MAAKSVSSYIPTGGAQVSRAVDALSWVFNSRPQAMTVYLKFIEVGASRNYAGLSIFKIGAAAPQLIVLPHAAATYAYRVSHLNGTSTVASLVSANPTPADVVELRATLSATGAVRIHQSLNGAAETSATASAANALAQTWGTAALILGNHVAWLAIHVERGIHDLGTMRRLAGVNKK